MSSTFFRLASFINIINDKILNWSKFEHAHTIVYLQHVPEWNSIALVKDHR